jgi:hypothetical protein
MIPGKDFLHFMTLFAILELYSISKSEYFQRISRLACHDNNRFRTEKRHFNRVSLSDEHLRDNSTIQRGAPTSDSRRNKEKEIDHA